MPRGLYWMLCLAVSWTCGCSGSRPAAPAPCAVADASALLKAVALKGSSADLASLERIVCRMLDSDLARERARDFLAQGKPAVLSWERIPGTELMETASGPRVKGTSGLTDSLVSPSKISLNRLFRRERSPDAAASALAHELLGHVLTETAANPEEDGPLYRFHSAENETEANLVGWVVAFELGGQPEVVEAWDLLNGTAAYHASLSLRNSYTSALLQTEQLSNPLGAFKARRRSAAEALSREDEPARRMELGAIAARLDRIIATFERSTENQLELEEHFRRFASGAFLAQRRRVIESLLRRFRAAASVR